MTTKMFIKLLKQIHNGDMHALTPIFLEYYEKMVISAQFILHNEFDAQDAASKVIMKIATYAKRNENPVIDNVGAYINRSIRNMAITIYNEKKSVVCLDYLDNMLMSKDTINPSTNKIALQQALSELSELERDIATMFYFYDYKIKSIGKELSIPEGTVKWKLCEIRKKLYKYLK